MLVPLYDENAPGWREKRGTGFIITKFIALQGHDAGRQSWRVLHAWGALSP